MVHDRLSDQSILPPRAFEACKPIEMAAPARDEPGPAARILFSEPIFKTLIDALPLIAFTVQPDGAVTYCNARWEEYTGQPEDGVFHAFIHPEDAEASRAAWAEAMQTGEMLSIEHRLQGRSGSYRWFHTRVLPLRSNGPETPILHWLGSSSDITNLVAARQKAVQDHAQLERMVADRTSTLAEAAQELVREMRGREMAEGQLRQTQKLETLGQLVSGVAHDFNNLLTAILGSFVLLRRRSRDERLDELIARGEQAAERASRLVAQLLGFARRDDPAPAIMSPASVLHDIADMARQASGPYLNVGVEAGGDDLWPVLADRHQLEVALLNLIINARDATPEGGTIRISARNLTEGAPAGLPDGDYVSFQVSDDGQGMTPEVLARVLEPFYTTKPRGSGTGLGLPMVRSFAQRFGGDVRVASQPGKGTDAEIILPRATSRSGAAGAADQPLDPALHGNARVLVVEDDELVRPVLAGMLRELGYDVLEAANAAAARVLLHARDSLDLLVTDIAMPGESGLSLVNSLRREWPDLKVLLITGNATLLDQPGHVVLRKPFSRTDLASAVLRRLGRDEQAPVPPSTADRLLARLTTPALRDLYLAWEAERAGAKLPRLGRLDPAMFGVGDSAYLVAVEGEPAAPTLRYLSAGSLLTARLGRSLDGEELRPEEDGAVVGSLKAAYARCARFLVPIFQSARYDFGDGGPVLFERLLLPLSQDGETVTHLLGIVLFQEPAP